MNWHNPTGLLWILREKVTRQKIAPPRAEGVETYVRFRDLGGPPVAEEKVIDEIKRWPLDAFLGYLGGLSVDSFQRGMQFLHPRYQGHFLNLAILDDFPCTLKNASAMYKPGHVPITGGVHILAHEHNMAWLAHAALIHADRTRTAPQITYEFRCRFYRLLLLINDLLPSGTRRLEAGTSLHERKHLCAAWLRHYQFNRYTGGGNEAQLRLARHKIILLDILPQFYPIADKFEEASGIPLQRYLQILSVFVSHLAHGMNFERRWLTRSGLCAQLRSYRADAERLLFDAWSQTPEGYTAAVAGWEAARPPQALLPSFDYVPLRARPLIEARPGEFVCPVVPFLIAKIEDDAYYLIANHLIDNGEEKQLFFKSLGLAYQEYASRLVSTIAGKDRGGRCEWHRSPMSGGDELTDDFIQRGSFAVGFEHKAGRPPTEFLRGGDSDRVVGPTDELLQRLEQGEVVTIREGREADNGYLTLGLWQLSLAGDRLQSLGKTSSGEAPGTIFPIITHLGAIGVDEVVYRAYLVPLLNAARIFPEGYWRDPQWLYIGDLEWLAALAESNELDLESLLVEKSNTAYRTLRFDVFLHKSGVVFRTPTYLREEAIQCMEGARATFFPSEASATRNPQRARDEQ